MFFIVVVWDDREAHVNGGMVEVVGRVERGVLVGGWVDGWMGGWVGTERVVVELVVVVLFCCLATGCFLRLLSPSRLGTHTDGLLFVSSGEQQTLMCAGGLTMKIVKEAKTTGGSL